MLSTFALVLALSGAIVLCRGGAAQEPVPLAVQSDCVAPVAPALKAVASTAPVPGIAIGSAEPSTLSDIFGSSPQAYSFEQRMQPYEAVAAQSNGVSLEKMDAVSGSVAAFRFGSDFIVLPPPRALEAVAVALPDGVWVNYWTGSQILGGRTVSLEVDGAYPMWARGGSVIAMRMDGISSMQTVKPVADSGNSCGANCLFDLLPAFSDDQKRVEKDADGRTLTRDDHTLRIEGAATHAVVRWRFTEVSNARVNGAPLVVMSSSEGFYAVFEHSGTSTVEWTTRGSIRSGRRARSRRSLARRRAAASARRRAA